MPEVIAGPRFFAYVLCRPSGRCFLGPAGRPWSSKSRIESRRTERPYLPRSPDRDSFDLTTLAQGNSDEQFSDNSVGGSRDRSVEALENRSGSWTLSTVEDPILSTFPCSLFLIRPCLLGWGDGPRGGSFDRGVGASYIYPDLKRGVSAFIVFSMLSLCVPVVFMRGVTALAHKRSGLKWQ